ncbi:MAG: prolyl oligopeptidase family serine peptidase [Myxococcaceae bacterium]
MLLTALTLTLTAAPPLPPTPKKPVVDTYFDAGVTDDYRWLEDGTDATVSQWSDAQNARARAFLDGSKARPVIKKRIEELLNFEAPSWSGVVERAGVLFAWKRTPPQSQPVVVVLSSLSEPTGERVLFDPVSFDATGETAVDFFEPSLDGKLVALSLSRKGTERGDVHVFDVASGKELKDEVVPGAHSGTAGGTLAWFKGGFFYTRHPRGTERPPEDQGFFQEVWRHTLGTPTAKDVAETGQNGLRIAEHFVSTTRDGTWAADLVQKGDGGEFELFVRSPAGKWTKVAGYDDKVVGVELGAGTAWLLSRKDAPRGQVLALPLVDGKLTLASAKLVVPQGEGSLEGVTATASRLWLTEVLGPSTRVRSFSLDGKQLAELVPGPGVSQWGVASLGGDDVVLGQSGYLMPSSLFRVEAKTNAVVPTPLALKSPADLSPYEVVSETCVSADGTKVPLSIVRKKGSKNDGTAPGLLTGYGGFGISISPHFDRSLPSWLELGGVWAEAALRGGGEFGETWHQQGMLTQKQHVFDDFLACAKLLTDKKYVAAKKLAIEGGSNGGLLMGAAMTQAPQQFAAVLAHVGIYDMLRVETTANGAFNVTEYGSVKDEAQFNALYAYSPYHRVKNGTAYPPVIFFTGKNDPRVDPWHSRKMVARLLASGTKQPVLLRTSDTGHGMGTPLAERIAQTVDAQVFLVEMLKMKVQPTVTPAK